MVSMDDDVVDNYDKDGDDDEPNDDYTIVSAINNNDDDNDNNGSDDDGDYGDEAYNCFVNYILCQLVFIVVKRFAIS